jgi:hypothetical protein
MIKLGKVVEIPEKFKLNFMNMFSLIKEKIQKNKRTILLAITVVL